MKSNKISLSIILTVLAGCVEDGDRMNLVRLVRGGEYDGSGSNNSQNKEIQLSNIVGSLSADQANSMYNGGTDVHSNDVNNSSTTLYSYNGNDKQYYPKYLQFSDSGDGVVATTQMDYYEYGSSDPSSTILTSTNISKNRDGSINIVLQDENKQKKLNVLLGANQLKDFNKIGSYLDYGIWQYNDGLPIYAVLYGSGQLGVINNDNQRTDIALKDGKRSVEFTGKTNAVKKSNNNNVTNLTGDVTIEFKANSLSNNNYGSELQSNVKLKYTGWKTIDFEQYADSNGIYNVKVDGESTSINGNMNMQFNQSESHEAGIGNEGNNVNVNVYDKVVGIYNLENIPENEGTVEIIGGFAAKAKDENNYFAITPDTYNY